MALTRLAAVAWLPLLLSGCITYKTTIFLSDTGTDDDPVGTATANPTGPGPAATGTASGTGTGSPTDTSQLVETGTTTDTAPTRKPLDTSVDTGTP